MSEAIRLQKYLSRAGHASRREAERLMREGRVRVNGAVVDEPGAQVRPGLDVVELDGRVVELASPRWVAFHKPPGVVTTRRDPHAARTIYDLLPDELHGLSYVGRLDRDAEGLLLLTNDGDLANDVQHPSGEVEREYVVEAGGRVGRPVLTRLLEGVELDDGPARALRAELLEATGLRSRLRLVLAEGRKREVRRMMSAVGHPVHRLRRVRFGPVRLGDLPPGGWRALEAREVEGLRRAARRGRAR